MPWTRWWPSWSSSSSRPSVNRCSHRENRKSCLLCLSFTWTRSPGTIRKHNTLLHTHLSRFQTWTPKRMSGRGGLDFLQSFPFTYEECSRRFSAQTCSQQHRHLCSVQVRGGTAFRGRMQCIDSSMEITYFGLLHIHTPASALITKGSLDILIRVAPLFYSEIFIYTCVCCVLKTYNKQHTHSKSSR